MPNEDDEKPEDQPAWLTRTLFAVAVLLTTGLWGSLAWAGYRAFT